MCEHKQVKPSDPNVCHTNVSYKVRSMPGKKALLAGYLIPFLQPQKPCNKEIIPKSAGMKELKVMNMLKQRRDNFQFEGKYKLHLKLAVFFTSSKGWLAFSEFFSESIKPRDSMRKKYLEFKTGLDHTQRVWAIFVFTVRCLHS